MLGACSVGVVVESGWMQGWHANGCRFNFWSDQIFLVENLSL